MKRTSIFISILLTLLLISCSNGRKVKPSGFDISDLETCMIEIADGDQANTCSFDDRRTYLNQYADYFLSDIDHSGTTISVELQDVMFYGKEDILLLIKYSNIPMDEANFDYDIYQKIFEEISYDINELTDVYTYVELEFEFQNYLTLKFGSSNNNLDSDDYHTRVFKYYTQDQLVPELFESYFGGFTSIFTDEAYRETDLIILADDYTVHVSLNPVEKTYNNSITSKTEDYFMTNAEIDLEVENFLIDFTDFE
ncbi:hypothetical protein RJI07_08105 [Mycoplasmatota bacterium WC30]